MGVQVFFTGFGDADEEEREGVDMGEGSIGVGVASSEDAGVREGVGLGEATRLLIRLLEKVKLFQLSFKNVFVYRSQVDT